MTGKTPTRKPRLRWWQWLCRAAVILVLLVAGAYATLPMWAPTGWLAREICRRLAEQAGCNVRIGQLKLSWSRGVEIHDLAIDPPAGGATPLASVRIIRAELAPIRLLLHNDLGCVELIEPSVDVVIDPNGGTNLEPLMRLRGQATPSSLHVQRATVSLHLPGEPDAMPLRVAAMEVDCRGGGQVTLAAALGQDTDAPAATMSLTAEASPAGGASASLTFSNLDLARLPLAKLADLPLRKLAGRADGTLDLRVTRQGVVDDLGWRLRVRKLDVQPNADVQLPIIDEALLDVWATYDQITRALAVQTARIRLPGVADLLVRADVGMALLDGHWEAIESLDLSGQVQPAELATMLTGRRSLPGELTVLGPVNVTVQARKQNKLRLRMSADATGAEIRRGQRVLKPAGRKWDMGLAGDLDHRTTGFDVGESWLQIASNRFIGYGALVSLRQLAGQLTDPNRGEIGRTLMSALARLDWRGEWQILDSPALLDLAAPADIPAELAKMQLAGPLTGRWFIHHGPATQVHASFHAGGETRLTLPGRFAQPSGVPLDLNLGVTIDPNSNNLTDLTVDLAAGPARLGIDGLELVLPGGRANGPVRIDGRFSAERIEDLLACVPGTDFLRRGLAGAANGRVSLEADRQLRRLNLSANLKDTRIGLDPWFCKPAGQEGQLTVELLPLDGQLAPEAMTGVDQTTPRNGHENRSMGVPGLRSLGEAGSPVKSAETSYQHGRDGRETHRRAAGGQVLGTPNGDARATAVSLAGHWVSPQADLTFKCRYRAADANALVPIPADGNTVALSVDARVKDASRIDRYCPALAELLAGRALGGTMHLVADARFDGTNLALQATCDASDLSLASPPGAPVRRNKPSGTPLRIRLEADGSATGGDLHAAIRRLDVDYAASRASLSGWAIWPNSPPWPPAGGKPDGQADRKRDWKDLANSFLPKLFDLDANAAIVLDGPLRELAPELDSLLTRYGLTGRCRLDLSADGDANAMRMTASLDAAGLNVECIVPAPPGGSDPGSLAAKLVAIGPMRKRTGSPALAAMDLSCPRDLSKLRVHNLLARTAQVQLLAGGTITAPADANWPAGTRPKVDLHASLSTPRAETLQQLLPVLRSYGLSGGVLLDVSSADLAAGRIDRAILHLDNLQARVEGKDVFANGDCILDGVGVPAAPTTAPAELPRPRWLPDIARLRFQGLEFRVGKSHGWVVADISNFPAAAKGSAHMLAERLDAQELSAWIEDPNAPKSDPARPWKLTVAQHRAVAADTRRLASLMATYLAKAELAVKVSADSFRTYDKSVMLPYEVQHVELSAAVNKGLFNLSYTAGLNGGLLHDTAAGNLADANSAVQCQTVLEGVLAEDNIKPQLAKFFPTNTILGTFSKREKSAAPLIDLLGMSLDARWPIIRVGENKTVAVEGFTQGRAAPEFVTRIFPGLNLAKYNYSKMTAFAELRPDGTVYNDMVYDGKVYDLFMEGTTDINGLGKYEIGLILLGTPQSAQWNHTYRQGRIPLLNFQARIEGGKMHDVQVSYLWPNETLFTIFLKNNIFYRIWLAGGNNKN